MTIPTRKEKHGGQSKTEITLQDPSLYQPDPSLESHWQQLQFVSNLPVIRAKIGVDSSEHEVQCMIDSGDLILPHQLLLEHAHEDYLLSFWKQVLQP